MPDDDEGGGSGGYGDDDDGGGGGGGGDDDDGDDGDDGGGGGCGDDDDDDDDDDDGGGGCGDGDGDGLPMHSGTPSIKAATSGYLSNQNSNRSTASHHAVMSASATSTSSANYVLLAAFQPAAASKMMRGKSVGARTRDCFGCIAQLVGDLAQLQPLRSTAPHSESGNPASAIHRRSRLQ